MLAATFPERGQGTHQHEGQGHAFSFSSSMEGTSRQGSLSVVGIPGRRPNWAGHSVPDIQEIEAYGL